MVRKEALDQRRRRSPSRHQLARWQREQRAQKVTWILSIIVVLIVLGIPAYGYYDVFIAPMRQTVVRVNDTTFSMGYYVERLRILDQQSRLSGQSLDMSTQPFYLLDVLRDNELIRQSAPRFNITVTEEEVTEAIRKELQPAPAEGEKVEQGELDRQFNEIYRQRLSDLKISDKEYRKIARDNLFKAKMMEQQSVRVPAVAEQAHVLGILAEDDQVAQEIKSRLEKGEDFGALAREKSKDEESRTNKGDLGWLPKRVMDRPFDDMVFKMEPGQVSEPFSLTGIGPRGTWIIKLLEKADVKEVDPKAREKLKERALEDWLAEEQKANKVERYFDSQKYEQAIKKLGEYASKSASRRQG